jgi:hypothetical protein
MQKGRETEKNANIILMLIEFTRENDIEVNMLRIIS